MKSEDFYSSQSQKKYLSNSVHAQLYLIAVYADFSESMVTMAPHNLVNFQSL